jgi:exopolysaccharide production protein ExoZ
MSKPNDTSKDAPSAPTKGAPGRDQLESVQVLRAVAALLVVLTHGDTVLGQLCPGRPSLLRPLSRIGAFGVDIFFVISGAIMVIVSTRLFGDRSAGRAFFAQRITRIYPPYWLYLSITAALFLLSGRHASAPYLTSSYLLLPVLNLEGKLRPLLGVGWTLTYELYFYLVFALVLALPRRRALAVLVGGLALLCAAARALLDPRTAAGVFLQDPIVLEFAAGALIGASFQRLRAVPAWVGGASMLAGVALVSRTGNLEDVASERWWAWGTPAVLLVFGALVIQQTARVRYPRVLVGLGDSSYTLYLMHPVLFSFVYSIGSRVPGLEYVPVDLSVIAVVGLAAALSYPAYRFVELPLIRMARKLNPARPAVART